MKKTSTFQLFALGLFILFAIGGVILFSVYKRGTSQQAAQISVNIWGTLDANDVNTYLGALLNEKSPIAVTYTQISSAAIYNDYLEAVADGQAPDALLLSQDDLEQFSSKIFLIPYSSMPQSTFDNSYIQESQLYIGANGLTALPFAIDPLVMYWNKDIFTDADVTTPPTYWEQFLTLTPTLTQKSVLTVNQSAVALGEYANVDHAKDIVSLLMMQAGNPITAETALGLQSTLVQTNSTATEPPADAALSFYTEFADPTKQTYTWNSSLPDSLDLFTENQLGVYFGFASEDSEIQAKNPNLNFGTALVPQPEAEDGGQSLKMTFGELYGLAITRAGRDPSGTLQALLLLTSPSNLKLWSSETGLPSVAISQLTTNPADPDSTTLATSALWARGWDDPNDNGTDTIFQEMIENVTSGKMDVDQSVTNANGQLRALISSSQ